jgi:hypothetical protein
MEPGTALPGRGRYKSYTLYWTYESHRILQRKRKTYNVSYHSQATPPGAGLDLGLRSPRVNIAGRNPAAYLSGCIRRIKY